MAFKTSKPDWENGPTYQLFEEYVADNLTCTDDEDPKPIKVSKPGLVLPIGPTGIPILPKHCLVPKHSKDKPGFAKKQKEILRAFVNATYSQSLN